MADKRSSYGNILKATALFGGVRVFQIIIHIIRAKVVAMLIGPAGMGIHNLLKSTLDTVNHVTGCGLQTSAVRDVANAYDGGDQGRIDVVITSLRLIVWITGLIGIMIVFLGSPQLSYFAFGNYEYSTAFKYLSIIMFATQLNTGQTALLQGTFHYKELAKSSLIGNLLSLLLTIPLYYYFREEGIVPALIIASLITLYFSWQASRKVTYHYVKIPFSKLFLEGKGMLALGIVLALGGLIGNLSSYLMNIYISHSGSITDVGLYTAGTTIANSYIFLVMSSMSTDYIPRLSALNGNVEAQIDAINKQIELLTIILLPLLVFFIVFSSEMILLLYSSEFMVISSMLELFMLGMLFQAFTWCLSYAVVARGEKKVFLLTEIYNLVISIVLKIVGFYFAGLVGIGVAFIIDYLFELLLIYIVCSKKYSFRLSIEGKKIIVSAVSICLAALFTVQILSSFLKYAIGMLLLLIACVYSIIELNKRVNLKAVISKLKG